MTGPNASGDEHQWLRRREAELRRQGICPSCHNLATGELYGDQPLIEEDDLFQVTLEGYPRVRGHAIVLYKPHRPDLSALSEEEAGFVFARCVRVVNAIKRGLGAEKVYLNTMCDGELNHLHLQLFPRYPGDPTGSKRFVAERRPLTDGEATARLVRAALPPPGAVRAPR
jgi:diadenosine tetraphosphate (Ap4A) HIT family hydrolase